MRKPVAIVHGKPDKSDPIEMTIYNQAGNRNYETLAKVLLASYIYDSKEIIDTLCKIKKDIQSGPHRKAELKHFMHNAGILLAELIKANPNDEGLKQIRQYVTTPFRDDRAALRESNPGILDAFHNLMTISRRPTKDEGLALLSMTRAWQHIRRAAQLVNANVEQHMVISAPLPNKPPPPTTPRPTQPTSVPSAPSPNSNTTSEPAIPVGKKIEAKKIAAAVKTLLNHRATQMLDRIKRLSSQAPQDIVISAPAPKVAPVQAPLVSAANEQPTSNPAPVAKSAATTSNISSSSFRNKLKQTAQKIYDKLPNLKKREPEPVFEIKRTDTAPIRQAVVASPVTAPVVTPVVTPVINQKPDSGISGPQGGNIVLQKNLYEELAAKEKSYVQVISTLTESSIAQVLNDYQKNAKKEKYAEKGYAKPEELTAFMRSVAKLADPHKEILACFEKAEKAEGKERAQHLQQGIALVNKLQSEYLQCTIAMTVLKIPPDLNIHVTDKSISDTSLTSILSNPFQRIPRYPMTIEAMVDKLKKQDNNNTELDSVLKTAQDNASAINKLTTASVAVIEYSKKTTNDNLTKILNALDTPQIGNEHKSKILSGINFSKLDDQGVKLLQQFAQKENNKALLPLIGNLVTEARIIKNLESAMPKNSSSPEAAFLKSLISMVKIQSSARRDNPAFSLLMIDMAVQEATKAFVSAGGKKEAGDIMAKQYATLLNATQNETKKAFAPAGDNPALQGGKPILSQFSPQTSAAKAATNAATSEKNTATPDVPHRKNRA